MGLIKEIPPNLVRKIAAGEVITRPVDIIKELIENSIDADSSKINVVFENGGIDRIIVEDNGSGIPKEDVEFAFKLHTSSKIDENKLFSVPTLGFRGEALSSISIVSKIRCKTRYHKEEEGTELILEAGKVIKKSPIKFSQGTRMEITGLFHNVPARRKFLKSPQTEKRQIVTVFTHFALMYPSIHFILMEIKNGRQTKVLESPSRSKFLSVVYDVLGADIASNLIHVEGNAGRWAVDGFVSIPSYIRKDRSQQFVSVNGRMVRHSDINKTIEEAYGSRLLKGNHPIIIIKLEGEHEWVDYNVHPQKLEIRFSASDPILFELKELISQTLDASSELPKLDRKKAPKVKETPEIASNETTKIGVAKPVVETTSSFTQMSLSDTMSLEKASKNSKLPVAAEVKGGFRILGHIMKKFALIEKDDELWVMDVHASDERVKFEQYESMKNRLVMSQSLLSPVRFNLTENDRSALIEHLEPLKKFGLEISLGERSEVLVHSVPVYFDQDITRDSLKSLLLDFSAYVQEFGDKRVNTPLDSIEYRVVARLACHGAVRSGYHVSDAKIAEILKNLMKCKNPWTCAHGRPTILRIDLGTIESWFKRTGQ